jgi:hypothetical protein
MSEVFITRKGGGGKASAPELLITEVGGSWIEFEVTNTDQVQVAQIFLLANYDTNSEEDFDFLAIQNGKVITVAAGDTVTEVFRGLNFATTHTISAQAAVIKKLPSNIVTTNPTDLLQTGIPVPTIATSNIQDTFFDYSLTNNDSKISLDFKIAITTSTAVPTNYPISQTNVGPNATVNLSATGLNASTTYYIHARAVDGDAESNNTFVSVSTLAALYAFTSWTFTTAGVTGRTGPNITQVRGAYSSQSWAQNNAYLSMTTNGIQNWTVPLSGTYRIEAFGAQGANSGGLGARMRGDFSLNRGQVISILVGQLGVVKSTGCNQGGGGGSFVWNSTSTSNPLIAAGGGGGAGNGCGTVGEAGTTGINGTAQFAGSNGNGGSPGGCGWNTNGGIGLDNANNGNQRPLAGGNGGFGNTGSVGDGGFGGGAGASGQSCGNGGPGGGGGYSGGGGPSNTSSCQGSGGGGSFNSGTNQSNSAGARSGDGQVIITRL